jgi:hypothetical protein
VHRIGDAPPSTVGPLASITTASSDRILIGVRAAGRLLISRRLADGTPDPSFGSAGWATAPTLVSSPEAATALEAPGGQVIAAAGSSDHPCAAVARFTSDSDSPGAPGQIDGTPCASTCRTSEGCPSVHRSLTIALRRRGSVRKITGLLSAAPTGCAESVVLVQGLPGPDLFLRSDHTLKRAGRTAYRYTFRLGRGFPAGRVYTKAYRDLDPAAGACLEARSAVIHIRQP